MMLAVLCCMASPLSAETSGLFTYMDEGKSITITNCSKNAVGAVEIPATINDKPVTSIGRSAFYQCASMTSIIIPGTVTSIADAAFVSCDGLTSITIPAGVTSIGWHAFRQCAELKAINVDSSNAKYSSVDGILFNKNQTTLVECPGGRTGSLTLPSSVECIERFAFEYCAHLTSVTIPNNVKSIGLMAFGKCYGLTSVTMSASLTRIEDFTFSHCSSLTSMTIPAGVTSIGRLAFFNCTNLTSITIPASVTNIVQMPFASFSHCTGLTEINVDAHNADFSSVDGVLFDKKQTTLIHYPGGKKGAYTIPAGVTSVNKMAFYQCTGLTAIHVDAQNANYTSVDGALYNKYVRTLICCPGGKTGSLVIPPSVTWFASEAFSQCVGLTSVTIPASVRNLGDSHFRRCPALKEINVDPSHNKYSSSQGMLFNKDLSNLIQCPCGRNDGVTIPATVSSIDIGAFSRCSELKAINVDSHNEDYSSVDGILFNKDQTALILCPGGRADSVTIPSTVFSIRDSSFDSCKDLCGVKIPDSVTKIEGYAFWRCPRLTTVTIPASVRHIGLFAFSDCATLTSAHFLGNAPEMGQNVFHKTAADFTVHYRKGKTGFTSPKWEGYKAVNMDESK